MPEWILSCRDFSVLAGKVIGSGLPKAFSAEELEGLRAVWAQPGAIRSMLAWYRANMRKPPKSGGPIRVPAMLLWGEQDRFLGTHLTRHTMELCDEGELVLFPDNTHWVNHEAAEEVCAHLIRFLRSPKSNDEGS